MGLKWGTIDIHRPIDPQNNVLNLLNCVNVSFLKCVKSSILDECGKGMQGKSKQHLQVLPGFPVDLDQFWSHLLPPCSWSGRWRRGRWGRFSAGGARCGTAGRRGRLRDGGLGEGRWRGRSRCEALTTSTGWIMTNIPYNHQPLWDNRIIISQGLYYLFGGLLVMVDDYRLIIIFGSIIPEL